MREAKDQTHMPNTYATLDPKTWGGMCFYISLIPIETGFRVKYDPGTRVISFLLPKAEVEGNKNDITRVDRI